MSHNDHRPGAPVNTTRIRDLLAQTMEDAPNNHEATFKPEADAILRTFIVIPKTDLPGANPHPTNPNVATFGHTTASRSRWAGTAEMHHERALAHLAAAEWIAAEPPVNEDDVEALAELLRKNEHTGAPVTALARRLLQTGQVQVNRDDR